MKIFVWIVVTILFYYGYKYAYQKYLDTFLYCEMDSTKNKVYKLPTLRTCMIGWFIFTFVALLMFNASNQRNTSEICNAFYPEVEGNFSFVDEAGYQEGWRSYQRQAEEGEQLNVSHKLLTDGIELIASQNQDGLVFVAVRIERKIQEKEHYVISFQDVHRGDGFQATYQNTGLLGVYTTRQEIVTDCEAFLLDIQIYNVTEGKNEAPVSIKERFMIQKAVSLQ